MDDAAMAAVALDDPWFVVVVLGLLAAVAVVRLALRRYFPPDT